MIGKSLGAKIDPFPQKMIMIVRLLNDDDESSIEEI